MDKRKPPGDKSRITERLRNRYLIIGPVPVVLERTSEDASSEILFGIWLLILFLSFTVLALSRRVNVNRRHSEIRRIRSGLRLHQHALRCGSPAGGSDTGQLGLYQLWA